VKYATFVLFAFGVPAVGLLVWLEMAGHGDVVKDGLQSARTPRAELREGSQEGGQTRATVGAPRWPVAAPSDKSGRKAPSVSAGRGADSPVPSQDGESAQTAPEVQAVAGAIVAKLETECRGVAEELAGEEGRPREDLLVMYGRTSAALGRFDLAAAAYAEFLRDFGLQHRYSESAAMRLADCLAPLDLDSVNIVHTPAGPECRPRWRMGRAPSAEHLVQGVRAYEIAAELASRDARFARALFRIGWVWRALNDWEASTAAWDRCAAEAPETRAAADALWLAAENLEWTGSPADAADRLRQFADEHGDDARATAARARVEYLQAEAGRSAEWLADPVASLQAEIESRSAARSPWQVYRSVVRWLQRNHEHDALIAVSRWACTQDGWPEAERISCRHHLADTLMGTSAGDALAEAAQTLKEIIDLAPGRDAAAHAAIRCHRVLVDLGHMDQADHVLDEARVQVQGSTRWEPIILTEQVRSLEQRGDTDAAEALLETLKELYPGWGYTEENDALPQETNEEGSP